MNERINAIINRRKGKENGRSVKEGNGISGSGNKSKNTKIHGLEIKRN